MARSRRLGKPAGARHISEMNEKPDAPDPARPPAPEPSAAEKPPREIGGPKGPEPTRYGDWEIGGRCSDF
jgi:hypothetical protein